MKFFSKLASAGLTLALALAFLIAANPASAKAATCYTYNPNGDSNTSQTPVFNNFCDAPYGIGAEADFVRVRQSANGNPTDNANNPAYTNTVAAACTTGTKFDVWNYVHNDASPDFNNNGSGTAVAHNVKLALSAPLNSTNSSFSFGAQVSASNAGGVSDTATITCNDGKQVKLTLVPSSVKIYSKPYGGFQALGDGAVNGTTTLGSPTQGSGDMWGCWDYRIVVVYQVTVTEIPKEQPVVTATCDLFTLKASDNRKVVVDQFKYTAQNVSINNVAITWGDSTDATIVTDATKVASAVSHQYAKDGNYVAYAVVSFSNNTTSGGANTSCAQKLTFKTDNPPVVTTTTSSTPPTTTFTRPVVLANTGPGSMIGAFVALTAAGAFAHRRYTARKVNS